MTGCWHPTAPVDRAALVSLNREIDDASAAAVSAEFDEAKRAGAACAILTVDSGGGLAEAALRIYRRAKAWTASGRTLIGYIVQARSGASLAALAADFRVLDPAGHFMIHDLRGGTESERAALQGQIEDIYLTETFLPLAAVRNYLRGGAWIVANRDGLKEGWIDTIGGFSAAVGVAVAVAAGDALPATPRRVQMAARGAWLALA